jgi:hypothetical protein
MNAQKEVYNSCTNIAGVIFLNVSDLHTIWKAKASYIRTTPCK